MKIRGSVSAIAAILLVPACFVGAQILPPQTQLNIGVEGNIIVARLNDGDSLFVKLLQISREYGVNSGLVLFSIGQLRDFAVGQYNPVSKRYVSKSCLAPWELVSLQGTIAMGIDGGGFQANCQATLVDSSGATIAGHLSRGIVSIANEIAILKLQEVTLIREYDVKLGLWILQVVPSQDNIGVEGNVIVARLNDGDSLFVKLQQISREHGVISGLVLFSIGQLRDFAVGQYNPSSRRYVSKRFLTPWELVSLQGAVGMGTGGRGFQANCQATLADSSGATITGHLSEAIVSIANEIAILKLEEVTLIREYDVGRGLWMLQVNPPAAP